MPKKILAIAFFFLIFSSAIFAQGKDSENQLALLYFSQGEYQKAADLYRSMFSSTHSQTHFDYLIACYKELQETEKAIAVTKEQIRHYPKSFYYQVKLATLLAAQGKTKDADDLLEKVKKQAAKQAEACIEAGQACTANKADSVAKIIYETGFDKFPDNQSIAKNLTGIYLHLGENEKLADAYIRLLQNDEDELDFVESQLQYTLYENSNPQLKQLLARKIADVAGKGKKSLTFKQLLLWLHSQDKDFEKAIPLSKEIDAEKDADGAGTLGLGEIALANNDYTSATTCFSYVVGLGPMGDYYEDALKKLLETSYNKLFKSGQMPDEQQVSALESQYKKALDELANTKTGAEIVKNLAHIQAMFLHKTDEAIELLKSASTNQNYRSHKSLLEMELADIHLFSGDIWSANMLYASIAMNFKNNDIGHEAQLKQAKIAYFNGNFAYAQALLDVLKGSTSKLISNDAFELSQLISDNTALDTTTDALATFARGDLLLLQGNLDEAVSRYDSIPKWFPGHSLEDEILMRKAEIARRQGNQERMVAYLQEIEDRFTYEIYADKAIFTLAEYYERQGDRDKAKEKYKKLILDFPNSFYASAARTKYREL